MGRDALEGGRYRDGADVRDFSSKCFKVIAVLCKVDSRDGLLIVVTELDGHVDSIVGYLCLCLVDQVVPITAFSKAPGRGSVVSIVAT